MRIRHPLGRQWATLAGLVIAALAAIGTLPQSARAEATAQAALPVLPAQPGGAGPILLLGYNVYLGGLHAFAFTSDFTLGRETYSIKSRGEPRGILGLFWKWRVRLVAAGHTSADNVRAQIYNVDTYRPRRDRSMQLSFDEKGKYAIRRMPVDTPARAAKRELPERLPGKAIDPLSVAFVIGRSVGENRGCTTKFPIFDGNRRYDLTFTDVGRKVLERTPYSAFAGAAYGCRFDMKRISGFRKPRTYLRYWDEDGLEPPVIWLARVTPQLPPVPVRMYGDLNMGGLRIYLVSAVLDGRQLLPGGAEPVLTHFGNNSPAK
jgi:hypothetical protein